MCTWGLLPYKHRVKRVLLNSWERHWFAMLGLQWFVCCLYDVIQLCLRRSYCLLLHMWGTSCSQWASWHLLDLHCAWMWGNGLLIFVEMMFSVQHEGREEGNLSHWDNFEVVCQSVRFCWVISEVTFSTAYQLSLVRKNKKLESDGGQPSETSFVRESSCQAELYVTCAQWSETGNSYGSNLQ